MRTQEVFEYIELYTTKRRIRASVRDYERMLELWYDFTEGEKNMVNRILTNYMKL